MVSGRAKTGKPQGGKEVKECSRRRQPVTRLLLSDRPSSGASAKKRSMTEGGAHPWRNMRKYLYNRCFGRSTGERDRVNGPDPVTNEPNFVAGPPSGHHARSSSSSMSGWVQGRGLVRWQWSSIVRRAYSGMPSRRRLSGLPSRRGSGSRARISSERVISCPRPSPLRPSPTREARSAIALRAPADPLRLHDGRRFTWTCPGWPPRRRRGRLLRGRRGSGA
jgi:hypothetical protein